FEASWRAGSRPDVTGVLAEAAVTGRARAELLRELLAIELEARLGLGERPDAASYGARLPDDLDTIEAAFAELGLGGGSVSSLPDRHRADGPAARPPGLEEARPARYPL